MERISVGGQAVIEGVMMRAKDQYTVAVRKPNGEIICDKKPINGFLQKYKIFRLPLLRGVAMFLESMVIGMKTLSYSAEIFGDEEVEEPGKFEKWLTKTFGEKLDKIIIAVSMFIAILFGTGLFMVAPMLIGRLGRGFLPNTWAENILEGVIRIIIFLAYMHLIAKAKDIERVFQYHGAEHKTINCYDQGIELSIENVKKCSRLHKSCGTSFLFIVMIVSILVFSLFNIQSTGMRLASRVFLVPVIAGISYEVIRWARMTEGKVSDMISAPGMWLQRVFTTREPDEKQLEVAIVSLQEVLKDAKDNENH